jgi:hypothetical protein
VTDRSFGDHVLEELNVRLAFKAEHTARADKNEQINIYIETPFSYETCGGLGESIILKVARHCL